MAQARNKFLFEDDFSRKDGVLNAQIENLIHLARQEGYAQGLAQTQRDNEARLAQIFQVLSAQMSDVVAANIKSANYAREVACTLALDVARKLIAIDFEADATRHLENAIAAVFQDLVGEPQLLVLVPAPLHELVEERLQGFFDKMGYQGRLQIKSDEALDESQAKVLWSQGSFELDTNKILDAAQDIVLQWIEHNQGRTT